MLELLHTTLAASAMRVVPLPGTTANKANTNTNTNNRLNIKTYITSLFMLTLYHAPYSNFGICPASHTLKLIVLYMESFINYTLVVLIGLGVGFTLSHFATQAPRQVAHVSASQLALSTKKIQEATDLFTIDATYPQFGVPPVDVRIEDEVKTLISNFKSDVSGLNSSPEKFELSINFDSVYISSDIISALMYETTYSGGAHPGTLIVGLNFRPSDAKHLTVDDALVLVGLSLDKLSQKASQELSEKLGEGFFHEGTEAKIENFATFVIDAGHVTFVFEPYQVAAYAAGPQQLSLPRKK